MLSALLQALTPDFHMCVVSGGEEGKKSYIQCIKKMKVIYRTLCLQKHTQWGL